MISRFTFIGKVCMEATSMGDAFLKNPDLQRILDTEVPLNLFFSLIAGLRIPDWQKRLTENPESLGTIEAEVVEEFQKGAGLILVGLIAKTLKEPTFDQRAELVRKQYIHPLTKGKPRMLSVTIGCGSELVVSTQYCEPVRNLENKREPGSPHVPGLDIEMSQFGFTKLESPYFQSRVARAVTLAPSIELARQELARQGIDLDIKSVRRITLDCGRNLLNLRERELQAFDEGNLESTNELKGKRVSVQIDGGRTRIRSGILGFEPVSLPTVDISDLNTQGIPGRRKRSKKVRRKVLFHWREPKLIRIFVHDDEGNLVKEATSTLDGTFNGPDQVARLVAMHLHQLGIAEAKSLSFVSDGAVWIWDRIDQIVTMAKVPATVIVEEVLDCCHAVQHVHVAIKSLGVVGQSLRKSYNAMRSDLRNGEWRKVITELRELEVEKRGSMSSESTKDFERELNYLETHGAASRLDYARYKLSGIPMGSGAIESSVRRVINQRMKSNGTHWRAENAEIMLQLRCTLLCDRWDARLAQARRTMRENGTQSFQLAFQERAKKLEVADSLSE